MLSIKITTYFNYSVFLITLNLLAHFDLYNHGQNVIDKFTKLSKTGFSMESFRADFSQFCGTTVSSIIEVS